MDFEVSGSDRCSLGGERFDLESASSQLRGELQGFFGDIGDNASERHATSTQSLIEAGETKMGRYEEPWGLVFLASGNKPAGT